jgi:AAA domain-containing protein
MSNPRCSEEWANLLAVADAPTSWLIEPFIPREGVVFMYGKKSIGKSPFIWALAQAVSEGTDFFGYEVQTPGPVLYVELDTPMGLVKPRLRKLLGPIPKHVHILEYGQLDSLNLAQDEKEWLNHLQETMCPRLVIVNTLRKAHSAENNQGDIPSKVYGVWRGLFSDATIFFVHHDKKSQTLNGVIVTPGDEDFSGSLAWLNDCQVGLHMIPEGPHRVRLEISGSQVGPRTERLHLLLSADGTNFSNVAHSALREVFDALDATLPKLTRYQIVSEQSGVSVSTVQRALVKSKKR